MVFRKAQGRRLSAPRAVPSELRFAPRVALISIVALLLVGVEAPASGAAGKKLKPYKSETATIEVGKWAPFIPDLQLSITVTGAEFLARCDIPTETIGLDAYVFEVPRAYRQVEADIYTTGEGTDLFGDEYHDIDIYIYDSQCNLLVNYATSNRDEMGLLPKGSSFVLLTNFAGIPPASGPTTASFRLEPRA